nr:MAG TPA: hypothetical protein [Caudoviricetes sp.]
MTGTVTSGSSCGCPAFLFPGGGNMMRRER